MQDKLFSVFSYYILFLIPKKNNCSLNYPCYNLMTKNSDFYFDMDIKIHISFFYILIYRSYCAITNLFPNWIHFIHRLFTPIFKLVCTLSHFGCVQLFATTWMLAHQAPLTMGFSRQEYWSGLPFLPPGDLPDPGTEPTSLESPALQADSLPLAPLLPHKVIN